MQKSIGEFTDFLVSSEGEPVDINHVQEQNLSFRDNVVEGYEKLSEEIGLAQSRSDEGEEMCHVQDSVAPVAVGMRDLSERLQAWSDHLNESYGLGLADPDAICDEDGPL